MARIESSLRRACVIAVAIISVFVFCSIVASYTIKVSVSEIIESEIKPLNRSWANNFVALNYDIFNSGTTGYRLRIRTDIYNNTNETGNAGASVATIWTEELPLQPGERNNLAIYWYGSIGNFTLHMQAYRAQEITDVGDISIALDDSKEAESVFTIERARTYDNEIKLKIRSSRDTSDVIIYPANYPAGWLIEQANAGEIKRGKSKWVSIAYDPALFSERAITFAIVGDNGRYYSEQPVGLKKEAGFSKYIHMFTDSFI